MCKFCEAMESHRRTDFVPELRDLEQDRRHSAAIVTRIFVKDITGSHQIITVTDTYTSGDGYDLNYCPECGRNLTSKSTVTNYEHLCTLKHYKKATAILNIGEDPCKVCPRDREDRCNDDCNNGLVEWLAAPYDPNDPVWAES